MMNNGTSVADKALTGAVMILAPIYWLANDPKLMRIERRKFVIRYLAFMAISAAVVYAMHFLDKGESTRHWYSGGKPSVAALFLWFMCWLQMLMFGYAVALWWPRPRDLGISVRKRLGAVFFSIVDIVLLVLWSRQ
jgi:hypothetical protein